MDTDLTGRMRDLESELATREVVIFRNTVVRRDGDRYRIKYVKRHVAGTNGLYREYGRPAKICGTIGEAVEALREEAPCRA
jgi:hypothetical protein